MKPKVVIIDNNPLSIASYAEEFPENWKKLTETKEVAKPQYSAKEVISLVTKAKQETAKEIFTDIEKGMTFNTYLGDTFAKLTMERKDWEKLKAKYLNEEE